MPRPFLCQSIRKGTSGFTLYMDCFLRYRNTEGTWRRGRRYKRLLNVKVIPQQAEVAQGVPGRPRIFLTFGTTRVVGRQPYAPAAFIPGEIPGTHFQWLSRPQGTWFRRGEPQKKSPVAPPGIDSGTARLVAQCLNHYATPGSMIINRIYETQNLV